MKLDDDIHNYFEKLVVDHIVDLGLDKTKSSDYLADLSCLVLNQLPPRYIRYDVDMAFYLPQSKRLEMEMQVQGAMAQARAFLDHRVPERDTRKDD